MKAFNLTKTAKKSSDTVINEKQLEEQRSTMGQTVEKQGTTEKNINLSLPTKDKDNTVPFNAQLEASRKNKEGQQITEASMDKKEVAFGEQDDRPTDINIKTQEYDDKKTDAFKKAEDASKKDTLFWDKYVGVQMEGPTTTVDANIPEKASQLPNHNLDKAMSLLKDADAMLFHLHATAKNENRDLNDIEKQQIVDITSAKIRIMAEMGSPVCKQSQRMMDPVIKKDRNGMAVVVEHDGTHIDEFKSCEEAKANYPEGEIEEDGSAGGLNEMKPALEPQQWNTAKVFTKAPGFGEGKEVLERQVITVRPGETPEQALQREGFDPSQSRAEIIDR